MLMSLSIHIFDKLRSSRLTVDLKKPGFHPSNITNVLCTLLSIDTPGLKVQFLYHGLLLRFVLFVTLTPSWFCKCL